MRPNFPATAQAPLARSNVVPITSRLATAERLDEAPTEIGAYHTLSADPKPVASVAPDPFAVPAAAMAAAAMAAGASAAMAPPGYAPPIVASASLVPPQRRPVPWIPIAMVVGFAAFGVAAAVIQFSRPAQQAATTAPAVDHVGRPHGHRGAGRPHRCTHGRRADVAPTASAEAKVASAGGSHAAAAQAPLAPSLRFPPPSR